MRPVSRRIPEKLYREIHARLPIVCVDMVVHDGRGRFLLVRRANEPERGKWWFSGGRLLKNERLAAAARRKLREELGALGRVEKQIGVYEYSRPKGYFPGMTSHAICIVYKVRLSRRSAVRLDSQSADVRWFRRINRSWNPYIKEFLEKAGFGRR